MYWLVLILIFILCYLEVRNKKINEKSFYIAYTLLVLMLVLRKGQGTDYYNYNEVYKEVAYITEQSIIPIFFYRDPGYAFLNYIAIQLGIPYKWFSAIFSFATMLILYRFFAGICRKSMVPLFFFYSTFFLIYPFSIVRQGFTLAILLGFVYPLLVNGKTKLCILIIIAASLFHQSFLVCLLLIFIYKIKLQTHTLLFLSIPFFIILLSGINILKFIPIASIAERAENYFEWGSSILAIIVRIVVLIPIFLIPESRYSENNELRGIRNILICGFFIYSLFSFSELISSRLAAYFRVFEGYFILLLLSRAHLRKINYQLFICYALVAFILFTKDINSFIEQGEYENCNILTYPYMTVFNDDNTIMHYRKNLGFADRIE